MVVFKTTKVSLFGSDVLYYNGGWQPLASGTELIGGTSNKYGNTSTVDVKFDGPHSPTHTLNVDGCSLSGGFVTLVDESGNPLANYPSDYPSETRNLQYKYRCGGSWGPTTSFQTDANGQVFVNPTCASNNWDKKITMTLDQTTKEQDVTVNPVFQAAKVNVNLKSCDGLDHGSAGRVGRPRWWLLVPPRQYRAVRNRELLRVPRQRQSEDDLQPQLRDARSGVGCGRYERGGLPRRRT